jgi:hypothetical protein
MGAHDRSRNDNEERKGASQRRYRPSRLSELLWRGRAQGCCGLSAAECPHPVSLRYAQSGEGGLESYIAEAKEQMNLSQ